MSNISPSKPSFVLGYWRPWKEDSNAIDSYLDYVKDTKLAKYTADTVGKYVAKASRQQVGAINNLGRQLGNGLEIISDEIFQASNQQVSAITNLENQIGAGMNLLQNKLSDISSELNFLNRNNEILIEQQKLSNLLLQNISELLRVPDSEKERQHAIELGIKFFVNAKKDADLYDDALKYLLKAEEIYEEDYFVLHRLGLIYLHVLKHIDIQKAHDYFARAAKYASVESDPEAIRLTNVLINAINNSNRTSVDDINEIEHLAAESFEKAAFASYVLGDFEAAVRSQTKALNYSKTGKNYFTLAKYQARTNEINSCIVNLEHAIENNPILLNAVFSEIELLNEPKVIHLIEVKDSVLNDKITILINEFKKINLEKAKEIITELNKLKRNRYDLKLKEFKSYTSLLVELNQIDAIDKRLNAKIDNLIDNWKSLQSDDFQKYLQPLIDLKNRTDEDKEKMYTQLLVIYNSEVRLLEDKKDKLKALETKINQCISTVKNIIFCTLTIDDVEKFIEELILSKNLPFDKREKLYDEIQKKIELDKLKIGSFYHGGYVFYIDESGKHGFACSDKDLGEAIWGNEIEIETKKEVGTGKENSQIIINQASTVMGGFFGLTRKPLLNAARLCLEHDSNGYNDWFLPSLEELKLMYLNLHVPKLLSFKSDEYWTSSSISYDCADSISFCYWTSVRCFKSKRSCTFSVRAIRAF
jgi:hypothetical protein